MSDSEASLTGGESTPPSSIPSPELFKLTLAELTEENKEKAAKIKAEANKAFVGTFSTGCLSRRHQESLYPVPPLPNGSVDIDFAFSDNFVSQRTNLGRPQIFTLKLWIETHSTLLYGVIGRMQGSSWRNMDML